MTWWRPGRKRVEQDRQAVIAAEGLRDAAEDQQRRVEALVPRVDAAASSLRKLRTENHFSPLIDAVLRGSE